MTQSCSYGNIILHVSTGATGHDNWTRPTSWAIFRRLRGHDAGDFPRGDLQLNSVPRVSMRTSPRVIKSGEKPDWLEPNLPRNFTPTTGLHWTFKVLSATFLMSNDLSTLASEGRLYDGYPCQMYVVKTLASQSILTSWKDSYYACFLHSSHIILSSCTSWTLRQRRSKLLCGTFGLPIEIESGVFISEILKGSSMLLNSSGTSPDCLKSQLPNAFQIFHRFGSSCLCW